MLFHLPLICKPRPFVFLPVTKDEPLLILKVSPSVCMLYLNLFNLLKEIILALIPLSTSSVLHSLLDHFHQHTYTLCNIYHIKKKNNLPFDFIFPSRYCPIHLPAPALYSKTPQKCSLNHVFVPTFYLLSETHSIPTILYQTALVYPHCQIQWTTVRTHFPFLLAMLHGW